MLKRIRVYDIDGVLVDSSHRYRTITIDGQVKIDLPYWRENSTPDKIMADSLLPLHAEYVHHIQDAASYVVLATARVMQDADFQFIREKLGQPDKLFYRKPTDNRRGAELKFKQLNKLFALKQFRAIKDRVYFEDNRDYLAIAPALYMRPVFVESNQGY